jgi:hypothetical protein
MQIRDLNSKVNNLLIDSFVPIPWHRNLGADISPLVLVVYDHLIAIA